MRPCRAGCSYSDVAQLFISPHFSTFLGISPSPKTSSSSSSSYSRSFPNPVAHSLTHGFIRLLLLSPYPPTSSKNTLLTYLQTCSHTLRYVTLHYIALPYIPHKQTYIPSHPYFDILRYLHTYIPHTCIPTYPTCLPAYLPQHTDTDIQTHRHTYTPTHLSTYLHTYIPADIQRYIHTYLLTYLTTYLPTYIQTYRHTETPLSEPPLHWLRSKKPPAFILNKLQHSFPAFVFPEFFCQVEGIAGYRWPRDTMDRLLFSDFLGQLFSKGDFLWTTSLWCFSEPLGHLR